jgi:hypothetical protein
LQQKNPSSGPSPKRRGEKRFFSPLRFGEGPEEGFLARNSERDAASGR